MQALGARELRQLEDDAREMGSGSVQSYLADALRCLRETADPLAPLALLVARWEAGHARRTGQQDALDLVGCWLEARLWRDPAIAAERLALELGWLQRFARIEGAGGDDGGDRDGGGRADTRRRPRFGVRLPALARRRKDTLAGVRPDGYFHLDAPPAAVAAAASRGPTELPTYLRVRFADEQAAKEAFRKARERRKQDKPPKPRELDIRPVDEALLPLAAGVAVSMTTTAGIDELDARAIAAAGVIPDFWIASADLPGPSGGGRRVASRISVDLPPDRVR